MSIVTAISVIRTCPIRDIVKVLTRDADVMRDVMIQPMSGCHGDDGSVTTGKVFVVTAVYKSVLSCLARTSLGNHRLSLGRVKSKCLKGDIIKISF